MEAGTSLFEPRTDTQTGTPASDVLLSWPTLIAAAKDAGLSRRLGGIHFQDGGHQPPQPPWPLPRRAG